MNADLVAGKQVLSLELARELPEDTEGRVIELGGTFSDGPPDIHTGPSLDAVTIGKRTSLYRWHVTNDWRLWDFNRLSSKGTKSEIRGSALEEGRPEFEDAHTRALAASMARGHARSNIRLLVDHRDGRRIVY